MNRIDCLTTDKALDRLVLMIDEHASDEELKLAANPVLSIPVDRPSFLLNRYSVQAFNEHYYQRIR